MEDARTDKTAFVIYLLLSVAFMAVIFYFSAQTADESNAQSDFLADIVRAVLPMEISSSGMDVITFIIRKGAHFTEYAFLSFLYIKTLVHGCGLRKAKPDIKKFGVLLIVIATVMCILYASSDEFHQSFVAGRAASVRDVVIDGCGGLCGALIGYHTYMFITKRSRAKSTV